MTEILLCNNPVRTHSLQKHCGISADDLVGFDSTKPPVLHPYRPYLVGQNPSVTDRSLLRRLSYRPVSRELTKLSLSFGGDNVVALADITSKLRDYNIGLMGASTTVYANRLEGFGGAVKNYQAALMDYRHAVKSNLPTKALAKQTAHAAFQKMQTNFRHEVGSVTVRSRALARRGTPLTSSTRATDIARSSRRVTKLNVMSQVQASNLIKFGRYTNYLGNGLALIDFGGRIGNIYSSYQVDEEWERVLFNESSSFALSAIAGALTVKAGLAILIAATPVGWVALIGGGVAIAGAAAGTSMLTNSITNKNSDAAYDYIMNFMNWITS